MRGQVIDIVIATPGDIANLRSWITWLDRPTVYMVQIALPTLTGSDLGADGKREELTEKKAHAN